jgi:heparosan-N-sulfate-glucuronate 5-epimerase
LHLIPERKTASERAAYLARVLRVYAHRSSGPLSFWYERPELNERAFGGTDDYYMRFSGKAAYKGPFDATGIPLLDYQGDIGRQYNPIAIAQYGLARYNGWSASGSAADRGAWVAVADWLVRELRPNRFGVPVWMHDFDWPYKQHLEAPWYSGLAQGNGVSMLVRAGKVTGDRRYRDAADRAFESLQRDVADGGVLVTDDRGDLWIEEYLVDRPSHILNGFIWALWGVRDYAEWSGAPAARSVWERSVATLRSRLDEFDTGWWSLYEARDNGLEMLASRYYHALHITQLRVTHRLTGIAEFSARADRFQEYLNSAPKRARALAEKALFKLRHY